MSSSRSCAACLKTLEGHTNAIRSVALAADGRCAVSGSADNTLRVWDLETDECLKTLEGHTDRVRSVALTADGRRVVSGSRDMTLRVWDPETGQCLKALEGHTHWVWSVALTADRRRAVSGSDDNTLRVWDLETGECLAVLPVDGLRTAAVGGVVVAGTTRGSLDVFRPSSPLLTAPPWVTATRVWRFGEEGAPGRWDDHLSVVCT